MKLIYKFLFCAALTFTIQPDSFAQSKPPFWADIQAIKAYDQIYSPPENPILFIGSSSIRLWVDFTKTFKNYTVLNRGVGGESTSDTDRYLDDVVFPYKPKQIVIYVGENDVFSASGGAVIFVDFKKLYTNLREKMPDVPVIYLSIKGSPSRKEHFKKVMEANALIQQFLKGEKNATFLDVFHPMLDKHGEMQPELFKEDMLHMNAKGYKIWNKILMPHLIKD